MPTKLDKLDQKLSLLKEHSKKSRLENLNRRIYSLRLNKDYLETLSQDELLYIHARLHNSLSYKRPFAEFDKVKKVHDILVPLLNNHAAFDELDENFK